MGPWRQPVSWREPPRDWHLTAQGQQQGQGRGGATEAVSQKLRDGKRTRNSCFTKKRETENTRIERRPFWQDICCFMGTSSIITVQKYLTSFNFTFSRQGEIIYKFKAGENACSHSVTEIRVSIMYSDRCNTLVTSAIFVAINKKNRHLRIFVGYQRLLCAFILAWYLNWVYIWMGSPSILG